MKIIDTARMFPIEEDAPSGVLKQAQKLLDTDRVELLELTERSAHIHVHGSREQCLHFEDTDMYFTRECDCSMAQAGYLCEHLVAASLFLENYGEDGGGRKRNSARWRKQLDSVLWTARSQRSTSRPQGYVLLFSLRKSDRGYRHYDSYNSATYSLVPLKIKASQLPDHLQDKETFDAAQLAQFLKNNPQVGNQAAEVKSSTTLGANACLNASAGLVDFVRSLVSQGGYYYYDISVIKQMNALHSLGAQIFFAEGSTLLGRPISIADSSTEIELALEPRKNADGEDVIEVVPSARFLDQTVELSGDQTEVVTSEGGEWLLGDDVLYPLGEAYYGDILSIFMDGDPVQILPEQESFFVANYLVPIARFMPIGGSAVEWVEPEWVEPEFEGDESETAAPTKQLYLTEKGNLLLADLHFRYGDISVPYDPTLPQRSIELAPSVEEPAEESDSSGTETSLPAADGAATHGEGPRKLRLVRVDRQPEWEVEAWRATSNASYGLKKGGYPNEDQFVLRKKVDAIDFLIKKVPNLLRDGYEIFGEDSLKSARVNRNPPSVSLNISSGIDWFDIAPLIKFGDVELQLGEVRKALRQKTRYVKLADGTIGELPDEWLQRYRHLFQLGEEQEDGVRFSNHHLSLIDQLMLEADSVEVDAQYTERVNRLRNFEQIEEKTLSPNFAGELRPYQKAGFDWLHFLDEFDFGGCLADDMGLGKTIQVLAYLQSLRDEKATEGEALPPDLIVVPKSLLVNWEREAAKFTPNLRTFIHFGQTRIKATDHFAEYDMILTTYGIMRSDIEMLGAYKFHYVVLDESQAIKTPTAQVSKAARLLQSEHRLAMSGTPVENSTFELWSQFAFLNPGLLGTLEYYKSEFSNPIERHQDEATAELLRKMVYPFILRRTKEQVAPELPPRTERILYMDMEPAQRKFYEKTRDDYRAQLMGMIETEGLQGARMKVLEGLLRLRQICNHPKLVKKDFRGDSAKMILLMETLENLAAEGHKALVFSQFVQMLTLVRAELDKRKIDYAYLDGQTNKRQEEVDKFQENDDLQFFLISLKAGGVGLNLTAADYVIHIDPWWNPAAEMQATDRTHRIGQDKPVFVSKMITRNSVEEKILELQQRKKKLVEQLIAAEGSFFKQLTTDDVKVLFS